MAGGTVLSTVNGNLTLVGQGGGAGSGASNSGVVISNGGTQVRTTGTGSLSISGTGGNGAGTGANNYGVYVTTGSSGLAATGTGSITVTGTGGNSSGGNNIGAWVSYVTAAGGAITLNGTGGTGAGSTNVGLYLDGTITNTGAGTITLTGAGGGTASGNGSSNSGVRLLGGSNFTTVNGAFNITGTGGGAGTGIGNYGVYVSGTVNAKTTGTGSLTVTGTGGNAAGTGGSNHGIYSSVANGLQTTGSGSLILKGIKGGQATSYGIYGDLANEYNTTGTGNLSAYADTISLSAVNTINSAGVLIIAPYTNGTMGVGYSTGYTLNLNNTTLGYINGASYVFGALVTGNGTTSTSNLTVGTTKDFADKNVTFISGQDINLATTLTKATGTGTANYIFRANRNIYNSSNAGVSATTGSINLTLQSDYDSNDDGAILLNGGSIFTNGGNITIGGGSATITAGSGYAVGNAAYASGGNIGNFATAGTSLSAAGGNIIINGKGFNTTTDSNHGISVNTSITTTGAGTITLNGIAQGTSTSATNQGVVISGTTTISTVNGDLTLIGTSASSSGANNYGVSVGGSGTKTIQTTGAGNLIINGTSLSTGVNGRGVSIAGNYNATGTGDIIITGVGGAASTQNNNYGVYSSAAVINSGTGKLTVTGTGGGAGASQSNHGVAAVGTFQTVNGLLTVTGFGGNATGTGNQNDGVSISTANGISTTGTGSIIVNAVKGSGAGGGTGLISTLSNSLITTGTGNITVYTDSIYFTVANSINSAGILTLATYTNIGMSIGSNVASTFNINNSVLGLINGASYVFGATTVGNGSASTSDLTINTTKDFVDKNVTFISGGNIGLSGTLTKATGAGTATYLMRANGNITNSNSAGVSATTGLINLTMTSDNDVSGAGNIALTSAPLTVNGGTITLNSNGQSVTQSGTIGGNETINSGNGAVSIGLLNGDIAGTRSLTVNAGTATFTTTAALGGTNKLNNLTVSADDIVLGDNLIGSGTLTIQPTTTSRDVNINRGIDNNTSLHLNTTEIGYLYDGWSSILLGRTNTTGVVYVGSSNWYDPVTFNSNLAGGSSGNVSGTITSSASNAITFINVYWYFQNNSSVTAGGTITFTGSYGSAYMSGTGVTLTSTNGNIIFNGNFSANNTSVVALNGTVSFGSNAGPQTAGRNLTVSANGINFNSSIWGGNFGNLSLTSATSISLPSLGGSSIFARTTGATADITIGAGKTLTASGSGNALTLVAGRNFINNSGSSTPLVLTGSGRYLVYSTNSTADTLGGMTSGFVRYGCTYGGSCPSGVTIPASGNGSIYAVQPTLTVTPNLINTVYGDAVPALAGYGYSVSGYLTGAAGADSGTNILTGSLTGATSYVQGNDVGTYNLNYSSGTLTSSLGYAISYANNANGINVEQRTLTASLTGMVSKTYDGTDAATLTSANYNLGNVYGADALTITNISGNYSDKNVGTGKNVSVTGLTLGGAKASNYTLGNNSVSDTIGVILQKSLTLVGLGADNKVYDATTSAALNGIASFSGIAGSDIVNLDGAGVGTFSDVNAGIGKAVTVTGYSISGTDANNYNFIQPTGIVADINKALLTITANDQTITYGATVPTSAVTYNGFVGSENTNVLDAMATLSSTNSGILDAGAYTGNYTVSGAVDDNYDFSYVTGNLNVLQRALTVTTDDVDNLSGTSTPVFTGSNNLLAADSLLITWVYAPIGYNVGDAGMYLIGATANDPSGRLANYVRTNNYGVYNVGVPPLPPTPTISAVPSQVISSLSVNVPISTFVILDIPVYNSNGEVVSTKKEWVDTSNLSNGNQPQTSNDFMLSYSDDLKRFLAAY